MNRFSMLFKLLAIGLITGVILIALALVNGTITERQNFRNDAIKSIEASYAGGQTVIGPVLVRPYTETTYTSEPTAKGPSQPVAHTANLFALSFPHSLNVQGRLTPHERHHGLYKVELYEFTGHIDGTIDVRPPQTTGTIVWGEPYLALSIEDVRGIVGTPAVTVNGQPFTLVQGGDSLANWAPNLHIPVSSLKVTEGTHLNVAIDLTLGGTERLSFAPIGDSNHIELASTWRSPLFDGQFLPRASPVAPTGFAASWDVPSLASGAQTQIQSLTNKPIDTLNVSLLTPIDPYKLSDRATKYGILFVLLTFGGFFLFEIVKQLPIHPIQYLLVGFGLAIFFLLLISFSEHLAFALAYLISSAACIGLLTFYLSYVLRSALRGLGFGAMLAALYAAIYGLLISEDNSLILGSLLLFVILTAVMVLTRRIDWYKTTPRPTTPPATPPPSDFSSIRLTH